MSNRFTSRQKITAVIGVLVIIAVAAIASSNLQRHPTYNFTSVGRQNLVAGLTETGMVKAAADLDLSFQKPGVIAAVKVAVGDHVKQGQVLAQLDLKDASASVSQAQAAVQTAQANYQKLDSGAVAADINVAQTALDNAKKNLDQTTKQQTVIVSNALSAYLNTINPAGVSSGLTAVPSASNSSSATITISGTYTGSQTGQYMLTAYSSGAGVKFNVSGLETTGLDAKSAPVPLGSKGLYIQTNGNPAAGDSWTISIPNTQSPSYVSDYNAYNAAVQNQSQAILNAQNAIDAAQAALDLKQTPARPEDLAAAQAQISTANAALQLAQNNFGDSTITAPINGIITAVNDKVGELANPGQPAVSLISDQKFQIETYVSEADLGSIKVGDSAAVTLDSYGSDTQFPATVISIDPSGTVNAGITSYKATLEFNQNDDRIKEGMAANITITDGSQQNALTIPAQAVITKNDQKFVLKLMPDGQIEQAQIKTGMSGLNGMVQVTGGLNEGDKVVNLGN